MCSFGVVGIAFVSHPRCEVDAWGVVCYACCMCKLCAFSRGVGSVAVAVVAVVLVGVGWNLVGAVVVSVPAGVVAMYLVRWLLHLLLSWLVRADV